MLKYSEQLKMELQKAAADVMYAERYCKEYMLKAQKWGLQGEKRRLRYLSVIYHNIGNFLNTDYFDFAGADLMPIYQLSEFEKTKDIPDFFNHLLLYCEQMYDKFHASANALNAANGYPYACKLLKLTCEICENIKYYRRVVKEGKDFGWSDAYIQRLMQHQTTDYNIHDDFEKKESEKGYIF